MEEQILSIAKKKRRSRKRRALAAVVVLIVAVVAAYLIVGRPRPWDGASYVPKDSVAAAVIDLSPSGRDKTEALDFIKSTLRDAGILGIDFEKDILPRLNGRGAITLLPELSGLTPTFVVVAGTRRSKDADSIMTLIGDTLNKKGVKFKRLKYKKRYFYEIPTDQAPSYVGAVERGLVYSNSLGGVRAVADTADGRPSLLDEDNSVAMRTTGESTFATTYFSRAGYYKLTGYYKLMSPIMSMGMSMAAPGADASVKEGIENNIAAVGSASADAQGLKLNVEGITKKPSPPVEIVDLDKLVEAVPEDAAFAYCIGGWDELWPEMKKELAKTPDAQKRIDRFRAQMQTIGFDFFADLLDRIRTVTVYYVPAAAESPGEFPGHIALILDVDKPDIVGDSLTKASRALAMIRPEWSVKEAEVAGQKALLVRNADGRFGLCGAVVGDRLMLIFGASEIKSGFTEAVMLSRGETPGLASSSRYAMLKKQLPARSAGLFYGDVRGLLDAFGAEMPPKDRKVADRITAKVGVFGVTAESSGTKYRVSAAVPFKK